MTHSFPTRRSSDLNNVWPDEVDGFRATFETLFAAFDRVGGRLLSGIARYLGLAPDFFDDTVRDGNSVMRLLHYPPVEAPAKRSEEHTSELQSLMRISYAVFCLKKKQPHLSH